jgi:hypothetical protein
MSSQRGPRRHARRPLPARDARRGRLRAAGRTGDLRPLYVPELRQDALAAHLPVVNRAESCPVPCGSVRYWRWRHSSRSAHRRALGATSRRSATECLNSALTPSSIDGKAAPYSAIWAVRVVRSGMGGSECILLPRSFWRPVRRASGCRRSSASPSEHVPALRSGHPRGVVMPCPPVARAREPRTS